MVEERVTISELEVHMEMLDGGCRDMWLCAEPHRASAKSVGEIWVAPSATTWRNSLVPSTFYFPVVNTSLVRDKI